MRIVSWLLIFALLACLFSGCAVKAQPSPNSATFFGAFDTVTTIIGSGKSEDEFQNEAKQIFDQLQHYHRLFDVYHDYPELNNLKTVNDHAGQSEVEVDPEIILLLSDCIRYHEITSGRVNIAMGSVLSIWHDARDHGINDPETAVLPDQQHLEEAARHCNIENIHLDSQAGTVYLSDPQMRLDVGAVAKGWAVQRVAQNAPEGMLINVGGNICATGPKDNQGSAWGVGVQNPDEGPYLHVLNLIHGSMVTSGDYQRGYEVDGVYYHHIIDPDTLFPGSKWRSVTVVCEDSGLADALSTALFLLTLEEGKLLLKEVSAEAMWVDASGSIFYSDNFQQFIRS